MLTLRLIALLLLQGLQIPQPTGYVNDFAHVIDASTKARLEAIAADVKSKSGGEIVVVTLPDLKDRPIEDVSRQIGRDWKVGATGNVGDRAKNAGVIILLVPKESSSDGHGHTRIETGYGAEGFLTDATTGAIQDEALASFNGDYSRVVEIMATRVAQRYATEFNFTLQPTTISEQPARRRLPSRSRSVPPFVWLLLFFIIIRLVTGGRRRRGCLPFFIPMGGGWGGGGFSGGGFGGGGFGGGG